MRISYLAVMMASIMVAAPGSAQNNQAADAPVLALVTVFSAARAQFDAKALDALLTSDYIEVSPVGEVDRRQEVLGFYAPSKATPAPPMTLGTDDVRRYGDIVVVVGSVNYAIPGPNGTTVKRTMRVTYVARRVARHWLMASTQYTAVRSTRPGQ